MIVIKELISHFGKKFTIQKQGPGDTTYERFTLLDIKNHITPADKFLYIHSKGVGSGDPKNKGLPSHRKNIFYWRTWLEYALMTRWKECLTLLDTKDLVGVAYTEHLIGPHFSGNFWWARGEYFMKLPPYIGDEYTDPEAYIFKAYPTYAHLDQDIVPNKGTNSLDLYLNIVYPTKYVDRMPSSV